MIQCSRAHRRKKIRGDRWEGPARGGPTAVAVDVCLEIARNIYWFDAVNRFLSRSSVAGMWAQFPCSVRLNWKSKGPPLTPRGPSFCEQLGAASLPIYCSGKCDWIKVKTRAWREANRYRAEMFNAR